MWAYAVPGLMCVNPNCINNWLIVSPGFPPCCRRRCALLSKSSASSGVIVLFGGPSIGLLLGVGSTLSGIVPAIAACQVLPAIISLTASILTGSLRRSRICLAVSPELPRLYTLLACSSVNLLEPNSSPYCPRCRRILRACLTFWECGTHSKFLKELLYLFPSLWFAVYPSGRGPTNVSKTKI